MTRRPAATTLADRYAEILADTRRIGEINLAVKGHEPWPLNSHVRDITLNIWAPLLIEQLGEVWTQQLFRSFHP